MSKNIWKYAVAGGGPYKIRKKIAKKYAMAGWRIKNEQKAHVVGWFKKEDKPIHQKYGNGWLELLKMH